MFALRESNDFHFKSDEVKSIQNFEQISCFYWGSTAGSVHLVSLILHWLLKNELKLTLENRSVSSYHYRSACLFRKRYIFEVFEIYGHNSCKNASESLKTLVPVHALQLFPRTLLLLQG